MSLPNHFDIVDRINRERPELLQNNTIEDAGTFTELVVNELAKSYIFEGWGHVGKSPGQKQYNGHAVDACMSKLDLTKAIDFIGNGGETTSPGTPTWQETESAGQPWMAPFPIDGGGTQPPDGGNGDNGGSSDLEARIAALEANAIKRGDKINLKTQDWDGNGQHYDGKFVCSEKDNGGRLIANRDSGGGPWELYTIDKE